MKNIDVSKLGTEPVLALILGITRADHFSKGTLKKFICNGYIYKWLNWLKEINDSIWNYISILKFEGINSEKIKL